MYLLDDKLDYIRKIENNIDAVITKRASPYLLMQGIENNKWNRYFLKQHYHIPTRLLDWTENALLALYFTLLDNSENDGRVWILEPYILNNKTVHSILPNLDKNIAKFSVPVANYESKKIEYLHNQNSNPDILTLLSYYFDMSFNNNNTSSIFYPLAIYPIDLDSRMSAQKTCFTIFGNTPNALMKINEENDFKILDFIIIDGKSKCKILKELKQIGIDHESIYPDMDGLGMAIQNNFLNQLKNEPE